MLAKKENNKLYCMVFDNTAQVQQLGTFSQVFLINFFSLVQTEAERQRREAGVKQSMEIRLGSCMWVGGYVWYLELSREPKHVAQ